MAEQIDQSLAGARLLRERIAAGDLEGAKTAWIEARIGWERAEVFTSGFVPDLDREIDAWPLMRYWAFTRSRRSCSAPSRPMSSKRRTR
jgi:uncharacterized iron-regulated protein